MNGTSDHHGSIYQTLNGDARLETGVIYRKTAGGFGVRSRGREIACNFPFHLIAGRDGRDGRKEAARLGDALAIGDEVRIVETGEGEGRIVERLPRRNQISRRAAAPGPGTHPGEQIIAANLDQVVAVFAAANPAPRWALLDRYLVSAESAEIPALVCVTKIDLIRDRPAESALMQAVEIYHKIGYPVRLVSALTGEGLDEAREALEGRVSALLGKSGVGKSTLLNALQPGLGLRVNDISHATGKGKHTTTHQEMFPLDSRAQPGVWGAVIDTPGIREFGLWEVSGDDLAWFFPEMRELLGECRFGLDCRHIEEPGCAIRKAVTNGEISPYRYRSYLRLREEI